MNQTTDPIDLTRFDVRDIPCRVKHAQIFQRWADLAIGQHFILINDHDPVPLWYQFAAQFPGAYDWEYLRRGPDEFQVKISKLRAVTMPAVMAPPPVPAGLHSCGSRSDVIEVDARGLEPPEPLVRILNALETLPAGKKLRAITDRQPCHLFAEAAARGFNHESHAQPDGSWVTLLAPAR